LKIGFVLHNFIYCSSFIVHWFAQRGVGGIDWVTVLSLLSRKHGGILTYFRTKCNWKIDKKGLPQGKTINSKKYLRTPAIFKSILIGNIDYEKY